MIMIDDGTDDLAADNCSHPFFGYGRQDNPGSDNIKIVANLAAGVNRCLQWICMLSKFQGFDIPVDHLYASRVFR